MIEFKLRLRAVTLLTVGWGVPEVMGADVVHARKLIGDRYELYVPGSSVKGALRTAASRVAPAYGFTSCGEVDPEKIKEAHKKMGDPCDVCKLFGWPEGRSAVFFSDFRLVGSPTTNFLTRISLDNKTLTAKKGFLYTTEHLLPGTEFEGVVRLDEQAARLLPLLLLAIAELRTGRFGRRSVVDAKLENDSSLEKFVSDEWKPLFTELKAWLWTGVVE
ncbi:MAG: RAMP superfamily CRISPR-associated protein [Infirmifilum sp.]